MFKCTKIKWEVQNTWSKKQDEDRLQKEKNDTYWIKVKEDETVRTTKINGIFLRIHNNSLKCPFSTQWGNHTLHEDDDIAWGLTFCMRVILSPFSIKRPKDFLFLVFTWYSSASSRTRFIYSSNPTMWPSNRRFTFSYSHTWTRERVCKYLKIRLMGCTITFWTFWGPLYAILYNFSAINSLCKI